MRPRAEVLGSLETAALKASARQERARRVERLRLEGLSISQIVERTGYGRKFCASVLVDLRNRAVPR